MGPSNASEVSLTCPGQANSWNPYRLPYQVMLWTPKIHNVPNLAYQNILWMVMLLMKMDGANIKSNQTLKVKMKILKCKG